MNLKFCEKCKTPMLPTREQNKLFLKCPTCNFFEETNMGSFISTEKIQDKIPIGKGVISDENILAGYENTCKKCGYKKAQILYLVIFYSDEDNLILLKCGKCEWSERIGRKTG